MEGLQRTPGTSRGDAEYQSGNAVPENEEIRAEVKLITVINGNIAEYM